MLGRVKTIASDDTRHAWQELETHFERFESQPPPGVRLNFTQRQALRAVNDTLDRYQRAA